MTTPAPRPLSPTRKHLPGGRKFFLRSKTIIGGLAAFAVPTAKLAGLQFDDATVQQVADGAVMLLAGILAIWGRCTADRPLRAF